MSARLDVFFDPPNSARRDGMSTESARLLDELGARLEQASCRTLLPARLGDELRWYAIASDGRQSRLLLEEVRSWLGPPIARPASMVVTPADEVDERALAVLPGATVARIEIMGGWQKRARENVERLVDTWNLAPERDGELPRPVGRVLRQFYDALLARDRLSAERALQEIQDRSLLSAPNARFLRVELLASLGTAAELRDHPDLRDVSLLSRPPRVTDLLAAAANELIVVPAFSATDPDVRQVAEALEDQWPGLVTQPAQVLSVAGARCLALVEASADEPRPSVSAAMLTIWGDDPVVRYALGTEGAAEGSAATVLTERSPEPVEPEPEPVEPEPASDPQHLVTTGDYAAAIEAIEQAPPEAALAGLAMHAALNLGEPTFDQRALDLVDRLDPDVRAHVLGLAVEGSFHEQLLARNGSAVVPGGWTEWLDGVGSGRPDLLRSWCAYWGDPVDLNVGDVDTLVLSLLDALSTERRARTRDGLPVLLDWMIGNEGVRPATVRLALLAIEVMLESEPGPLERKGVLELIDELLDQGCSAGEYGELVQAVEGHLTALGPRDAGWVAGCIDLLWLSSCPDRPARDAVTSQAFASVLAWGDRVPPLDHMLLRRVFARAGLELEGLPSPTGDVDATDERPEPRTFRSVGIYSLYETASRIASGWIREEWPGVTVHESHDKVNNERLEALVRGSDVVLVQTSRASHAATGAISAVGADPSRVVFVHGRGASALLRSLNDWTWSTST